MAQITNELTSLVETVQKWFVDPQVQAQHGGNVASYLEAEGYDTSAPGFVQDFEDASKIAVQPHVAFEASNQAIDIQGPQNVTNIASPVSAPAPLLAAPAAAATQAAELHAAVAPPPPPAAHYDTPEEAHQALQQVATYYTNEYRTFTTNNVDNRTTQVDASSNNTINAERGSHVDFEDNDDINTVSGDHAFGANTDGGDIEGVATGDRAAAAGDDQRGVATGDNAVAGGHDAVGATGDGSVAGGDDVSGVNTGHFEGTLVGDDVRAPLQTITGDVDGVAANDSHVEDVITGDVRESVIGQGDGDVRGNTGDLNRSVLNQGDHSDVNAITGDNRGIQSANGDVNGIQGDGNVGSALGHDASSNIDHSPIATNGGETGSAFDIDDSQGIGFGSGAVTNVNDSNGVVTGDHSQGAFVDSSARGGEGGHAGDGDWGSGGDADGGDADGGPVNINFSGDQTVAQDHSNAVGHGDQAVADDGSSASTDGDATTQHIIDSEDVAATGHDGDPLLDQSDNFKFDESFNEDNDIHQDVEQTTDSYNDVEQHQHVDTHDYDADNWDAQ